MPNSSPPGATVVRADAIDLLDHVRAGSADLAYLDPPFAVGTSFHMRRSRAGVEGDRTELAYDDRWRSIEAYLAWLEPRLAAARDVVAPHGTAWLHLDHRAVHEAKIVCDRVFGRRRFAGEVVWVPGNGSKARRGPGITHQTLLIYARSADFVWNSHDRSARAPFAATSLAMHFTRVDAEGRAYRDRTVGAKTYRYYADEGRAIGSVWTDCPAMHANTPLRKETTGYPTQKPLKLLDRIVRLASREEGLVVDPFCGSGTTLVAARRAGRRAYGSDIGEIAIATTRARLDAEASVTEVSVAATETT